MKKTKLSKIMKKLNKINISMIGLIKNKDDSYNCNNDFCVDRELVYNGKLIIRFNKINGYFICQNLNLTSLKNCPKIVNVWFDCSWNKLTSLKYSPETVNGSFHCWSNTKKFTEEEVEEVCDVKYHITTN
jgi:hypothetical protein